MDNIVEDFKPLAGKHCVTNSIRQIFNYNNIDLSGSSLFSVGKPFGII